MTKRKTYIRGITPEQETHLLNIKREFYRLVDDKYRKGVKEHGGNLWKVKTSKILDYAIDEAIDQVVYLLTMKQQLNGPNTKSR
jgi:hypothetical protein